MLLVYGLSFFDFNNSKPLCHLETKGRHYVRASFKSLDDIMVPGPGCNSELDYAEQSSWMLFLKYLDDMENERALEAQMTGKTYQPCV